MVTTWFWQARHQTRHPAVDRERSNQELNVEILRRLDIPQVPWEQQVYRPIVDTS